jgi:DUF971 family protein
VLDAEGVFLIDRMVEVPSRVMEGTTVALDALCLAFERGLEITWDDGRKSFFPLAHLRRASPSADAKALREEMARNPLTVLPAGRGSGPLTALDAELVGNYAIRIRFSDGHATGIYSWRYLRSIDPTPREGAQ